MKIKLLTLFTIITSLAFSQQVYYTIPGNSPGLRDFVAIGNTLYLGAADYLPPGSTTSVASNAILALDTSQANVTNAQVIWESNTSSTPAIITMSNNGNVLRFRGTPQTGGDGFYDLDLNQTAPMPNFLNGIPVEGLKHHIFYQGNFIYANVVGFGPGSTEEIVLPLQTLTGPIGTFNQDMTVLGNELYYIKDDFNLFKIDLTSATATPQLVFNDPAFIINLEVRQDYIIYGSYTDSSFTEGQVKKYDRTNNTISAAASLPISSNSTFNFPSSVEVIGNEIYYSTRNGIVYVATDNTLTANDFTLNPIQIHPNPATSILNIESTNAVNSIDIFSVLGKKVKTLYNSSNIDVSNLKTGVYFLNIYTKNGNSETLRFVKQ